MHRDIRRLQWWILPSTFEVQLFLINAKGTGRGDEGRGTWRVKKRIATFNFLTTKKRPTIIADRFYLLFREKINAE